MTLVHYILVTNREHLKRISDERQPSCEDCVLPHSKSGYIFSESGEEGKEFNIMSRELGNESSEEIFESTSLE